MQLCLDVKVPALETNGLVFGLAPDVAIVGGVLARGLLGLYLLPRLYVARVIGHPLGDGV